MVNRRSPALAMPAIKHLVAVLLATSLLPSATMSARGRYSRWRGEPAVMSRAARSAARASDGGGPGLAAAAGPCTRAWAARAWPRAPCG